MRVGLSVGWRLDGLLLDGLRVIEAVGADSVGKIVSIGVGGIKAGGSVPVGMEIGGRVSGIGGRFGGAAIGESDGLGVHKQVQQHSFCTSFGNLNFGFSQLHSQLQLGFGVTGMSSSLTPD